MIVPITTQPPADDGSALEIPPPVKRHLGLDPDRRSWIILSEANLDAWPSPDMRPIPGQPGCFTYGLLPQRMVNMIRETILVAQKAKPFATVHRDDGP